MIGERWTMVYPYYNNPGMLELQVANWSRFEGKLRDSLRIVVVDDCSTESPLPILRKCKTKIRCFRLDKKWPWNMHEARNIGAREACSKLENWWLFMSDIDIVLTPEMAYTMMDRPLDPYKHYMMERTFAPEMTERKVHPNTFLVKHSVYWQVNGYDLDLAPVGGGGYGGDNQFLRQVEVLAPREHLADVVLVGYGRRSRDGVPAVVDADTSEWSREEWAEKYKAALQRKKAEGDMRSMNPIRTSYERVM